MDTGRLERSCEDAIALGTGAPGIERAAVYLRRRAFAPHRHDTYAVGVTLAGVQRFRYRGAQRTCLPGQLHVLHPDEEHDGGPGTADGFAYRIVYIDPALVQAALGGAPLPFVADPVLPRSLDASGALRLLDDLDEPLDELRATSAVAAMADLLLAAAGGRAPATPLDLRAVAAVRDHLAAHPTEPTPAAALERIAGLDRWTLARHFRAAYGTSPDRYRTMRRLAVARRAIADGSTLAAAAAEAGFADQSHLTRQFRRAYGLTPGRFAAATGVSRRKPPPPGAAGRT